jgi:hypothetical protein
MSLFNVGFVIFPELTQLDFTGPQQVLARLPQSAMHIIAKTTDPVPSRIDFGLSVVAEIAGETVAQAIQLGIEYDPNPPFDSGNPDRASDTVKATVAPRYEQARASFRERLTGLPTT